jgi:hypothetical protein
MVLSIEKQNEYPDVTPGDLAYDFSKDPEMHGHHHLMCLKDREQYDNDIKKSGDAMCDLLKRVEDLERTVSTLAACSTGTN